jgi:hypothetical protein
MDNQMRVRHAFVLAAEPGAARLVVTAGGHSVPGVCAARGRLTTSSRRVKNPCDAVPEALQEG